MRSMRWTWCRHGRPHHPACSRRIRCTLEPTARALQLQQPAWEEAHAPSELQARHIRRVVALFLIAAYDQGRGMGYQRRLPWPALQDDLARLQRLSEGTPCIMGRTTYTNLPSAMLRTIEPIVVSKHAAPRLAGHTIVHSLNEAIAIAALRGVRGREPAVWGGAQLYVEALNHPALTHAYITRVLATFEADTFFPHALLRERLPHAEGLDPMVDTASGIRYRYVVHHR